MNPGPTPLYHRLFTTLRDRIAAGTYAVGSQLPTESGFIAEFAVGRHTVRAALQQLEQEGLIERFAGRGTFVTAQSSTRNRWTLDTVNDLISVGLAAKKYALVSADFVPARSEPRLQALFGVAPSARLFFVRVLRSSDDGPYALSRVHMPGALGEKLPRDLVATKPLLPLAEAHAGVLAMRAQQVTTCAIANDEAAALLEVPVGTPLLVMARTYFGVDGNAFAHSLVHARSDRYEQVVNVWRGREHDRAGAIAERGMRDERGVPTERSMPGERPHSRSLSR